jgi:hypothetical protein
VQNSLTIKPTIKITRTIAFLFTDDIVYFSQDMADAYHTVPLGLRRSPSAFSVTTFGYLGVSLPINLLVAPPAAPGTSPYPEVD